MLGIRKNTLWVAFLFVLCGSGFGGCRGWQERDEDDWETLVQRRTSAPERALQQRAMMALGEGKAETERALWLELLKTYPATFLGGQAHMRLGLLAYKKRQWSEACKHFVQTQKRYLSAQERNHVLMRHARALSLQKRDAELIQLLQPRYKKLSLRAQEKSLELMIEAAQRSQRLREAFRWRLALLMLASGQNQQQLRTHIEGHVKKLSLPQLEGLLKHNRANQEFPFPLDLVAFRLAQKYYETDRFEQAKQLLSRLHKKMGLQHPLYRQTGELLAEVKEVRRPADARVIGAILPMTGPGVNIGTMMRNAIELAIQDYPQVRVIYKDSMSLPGPSALAVDELVRRHKAIAIFGPPLPKQAVAAAKRAQKLGVPLISITAHEKFADIGSFIFRNNLTLSMMGTAVARYSYNQLRIKRFGVLYPASNYGRVQATAFLQEIRRLGAKLTSAIEYDPVTTDFQMFVKILLGTNYENAHLLRLSSKHMSGLQAYQKQRLRKKVEKMLQPLVPFEGLFLPEQAKVASQIAAYLAYYNVGLKPVNMGHTPMFFSPMGHFRKIQLLGNNNWYHQDLFQAGPQYVRGGLFCVRFFAPSYRNANQQFVQAYQRTYSQDPIHINAYAYDAMRLFASIASTGKVRTRPRFQKALLQIKDFEGPTGPLHVQSNGEVLGPIHFVMAYKGTFRIHGTLQ